MWSITRANRLRTAGSASLEITPRGPSSQTSWEHVVEHSRAGQVGIYVKREVDSVDGDAVYIPRCLVYLLGSCP